MNSPEDIKAHAVGRAEELGFAAVGVAAVGPAAHGQAFREWLAAGRHASMDYMARHVEQRCDIRVGWPWARSVLCLAAGYVQAGGGPDGPIARYARGRDYHKVLKRLCHRLADELAELSPGLQARACVDTAPLLERDWAAGSGLGWIGKNGCLIHPTHGSYLLLAEIVLSIDLPVDTPIPDRCGDCTRCLDACPNGALLAPRVLDARRCNSWATIENRATLDGDVLDLAGQVFGCDCCQSVCPFNTGAPAGLPELATPKPIASADVLTILNWSQSDWDAATVGTATRRAKYAHLLRNAAMVAGQTGMPEASEALRRLTGHSSLIVADASAWALRQDIDAGGQGR